MERQLQQKVAAGVRLVSEGTDRYRVLTLFQLDDGDHLSIVLRREGDEWSFSDEAHTYMHMSYDVELSEPHKGARQKMISSALVTFGVDDRDGELVIGVSNNDYGTSLFSFVQALLKISDASNDRIRRYLHRR